MPTLAQLNAEAARTASFLGTANLTPGRAPSALATQFGGATVRNQAGGVFIAGQPTDRRLNLSDTGTTASRVGVSGTVTRFGTDPRLAARGSFQNAVRPGGGGGGGGGEGGGNIQASRSGLDPSRQQALDEILAAGGGAEAQVASGQRTSATSILLNTLASLSPGAAQSAAAGAVDSIIRRTLDEALPQLQAAGEGAGASRSALDQLQLNDIAARTGEAAANVILESIVNFAQAQAAIGATTEALTRTDPITDQITRLITATPPERVSAQGELESLAALGLLPEGADLDSIQTILSG